jgi:hypothetical protein
VFNQPLDPGDVAPGTGTVICDPQPYYDDCSSRETVGLSGRKRPAAPAARDLALRARQLRGPRDDRSHLDPAVHRGQLAARPHRRPVSRCAGELAHQASAAYATPGGSATGHVVPLTSGTSGFWFLSPDNPDLVVRVGRACPPSRRSAGPHAAFTAPSTIRTTFRGKEATMIELEVSTIWSLACPECGELVTAPASPEAGSSAPLPKCSAGHDLFSFDRDTLGTLGTLVGVPPLR